MLTSRNSNDRSSLSIYVGPEHRQFILLSHFLDEKSIDFDLLLQRCGSSQNDFSDAALQEFRLEAVDPEAFSLFVQWLYGIELPRAQRPWPHTKLSLDDGNLNEVPLPAQLQSSGALQPLVMKVNFNGFEQDSFNNIVFRDPYRKFSAEEIRLADMLRSSITATSTSPTMDTKCPSESLEQQSIKTETGEPKEALLTTATEENHEYIQVVLLKLMLLAEMAGWKQCHKDAYRNYRLGEKEIERESINLKHIEMAYSTIEGAPHKPDCSLTLKLIAKYAYLKGTKNGLLTVYLELFNKFPRFLKDIRSIEQASHPSPA
ncbi:nuclear protein 96-domain-containing protein [Apiospora hydei]|uniref:Nuclear protein 96-domain-containing protein n=1 Tax=Apiospora hydei TaxID=1337664 RepID=A0ABR1WZF5_9PEZI